MELTITDTTENMAYWLGKSYLNDETRSLLNDVDVMIVPEEEFRDYEIPLFPSNMMSIYDLLKQHLNVEAVINDEDYQEVALNSKVHRYGKYVVTAVVVPVFVSVMSNYITDKLKHESPKDEINLEIVVQNKSGKAKSIKYQGSAEDFKKVADQVKALAEKDNEHRTDTARTAAKGQPKGVH